MRVHLNFSDDVLPYIDMAAQSLGLSRSAFVSLCCSSRMNFYEALKDNKALNELADSLKCSD